MRLLNTSIRKLEIFIDQATAPPYAILSHTWGSDEVSFQEVETFAARRKEGYEKIQFACEQALRRNMGYVWVDTCCIDKTSSTELSEAINSMFKWYIEAKECYVYLVDVPSSSEFDVAVFEASRRFTRGWTLQELLAPRSVDFFSKNGHFIGTKSSLGEVISRITNIHESYLSGDFRIHSANISHRMSWVSSRVATRSEDIAYCLLGIFDINIPLLYGEGSKAFIRLQEEIMKISDDQTLFAWNSCVSWYTKSPSRNDGLLRDYSPFAPSRAFFNVAGDYIPDDLGTSREQYEYHMSNKGISITLPVIGQSLPYAVLSCRDRTNMFQLIGIPICFKGSSSCTRQDHSAKLNRDEVNNTPLVRLSSMCRGNDRDDPDVMSIARKASSASVSVIIRTLPQVVSIEHVIVLPAECWNPRTRIIDSNRAKQIQVISVWLREKKPFDNKRWSIFLVRDIYIFVIYASVGTWKQIELCSRIHCS